VIGQLEWIQDTTKTSILACDDSIRKNDGSGSTLDMFGASHPCIILLGFVKPKCPIDCTTIRTFILYILIHQYTQNRNCAEALVILLCYQRD